MAAAAVAVPYLLAAGSAVKAYSGYRAGVSKARGFKLEAEQEKLRAEEEGIKRREDILNTLAAQNAAFGAGGVTGGVFGTSLTDIGKFETEETKRGLMTNIRQKELRRKGRAAKTSGIISAGGSLLRGASDIASIG